ncbi:MAG: thioredoxin family protein, partial [Candidatus Aminicenantes bacterium]|nr:thioredoxin family protein [Candidatus Aminicenantes bacterium]
MRTFEFSQEPLAIFEGTVEVKLSVGIPSDFIGKDVKISGRLHYQACDEVSCKAPAELDFIQVFDVTGGTGSAAGPSESGSVPPADLKTPGSESEKAGSRLQEKEVSGQPSDLGAGKPTESEQVQESDGGMPQEGDFAVTVGDKGLLLTFLLIFLGGLALNLTPCVYPIIPITIGYFGGQAEGRKGGVVAHAVMYVLGMAVTYSTLGVIASLTGSLFGSAMQSPFVLIAIALVMIGLALSMFDLYEFRLPSFLTNMAGGAKKGYLGTLVMGLTVGIVAAPCIGPFVLGLLTYVGEKGSVLLGFLMFFVLALGLGLPFLFLAIFSGSISKLPRSGAWMVWVRIIFGFILLAMAVYFLRPLFPDTLVYHLVLALILLVGGIYMAWIEPTRLEGKVFPLIRNVFGILFFGATLLFAVNGIREFVENRVQDAFAGAETALSAERILWQEYSEERIQKAMDEGQPVMIDFSADWCIPCKELDKLTFTDSRIIEVSRKFVMLKADMTRSRDPRIRALEKKYGVKGVPTLVLLKSDGSEASEWRTVGFLKADNLLPNLRKTLESSLN